MQTLSTQEISSIMPVAQKLHVPDKNSHKGQNGKLLVIGGSELFHAPLVWSAEVASHVVDMVHVASPYSLNNQVMELRLKQRFFNGIVVPWEQVEEYIQEDDCVLIGPGMTRRETQDTSDKRQEIDTKKITDYLLQKYPEKKWVVDGGALQEVEPKLLQPQMIVTPHHKEWERLSEQETRNKKQETSKSESCDLSLVTCSLKHDGLTILLKGPTDVITQGEKRTEISGGNEGMTKGGTGDVLAGLTAALATTNDNFLSAQVASWVNKRAGDLLHQKVGRFFTATDLVGIIPQVLHEITGQ